MAFLAPSPSKVKPFSFARPFRRQTECAVLSNVVKFENPNKFSSKLGVQFLCYKEKGRIGGRVFPIVMAAAAVPVPDGVKDSGFGKILFSDVEVKRPRNVFWGRQWNSLDVATAAVLAVMHVLCLFAPFTFSWGAFSVAFWLYLLTGLLGITLSFHRNLSHRSFKLPKWLEYFCAYCGVQALQVSSWIHFFFKNNVCVCFWIMNNYHAYREIQLIGWVLIGTTTSSVILRGILIVPMKGFGSVTWIGSLTPMLLLRR